jgi:hypothetical protein
MNEKAEKRLAENLKALSQFERESMRLEFTQASETTQNRCIFLRQKGWVFIREQGTYVFGI